MKPRSIALELEADGLWARYQRLSPGRKFIIVVFMIWLAQALPKWTAAVTADGEMSAQIMKLFVTPRAEKASLFDQQGQMMLVEQFYNLPVDERRTVNF